MTYTIGEQISEVKRELGMRRHVYPRFVEHKRITQAQADERIAILEATLATLERVRDHEQPQLFGVVT